MPFGIRTPHVRIVTNQSQLGCTIPSTLRRQGLVYTLTWTMCGGRQTRPQKRVPVEQAAVVDDGHGALD